MNTKEAIEFLREISANCNPLLGRNIILNDDLRNDIRERLPQVIKLLQRNKKLETILQLIEEMKIQPEINEDGKIIFILKTNEKHNKVIFSLRAVFRHLLCHTLKELEKKYFPKEVIK